MKNLSQFRLSQLKCVKKNILRQVKFLIFWNKNLLDDDIWKRILKRKYVFWFYLVFLWKILISPAIFGRETKCGTKHFSQTFNGFDCQQKSQTWLNSSIITWTTVLVFVTITIIICKKLYIFSIHQLDRQLSFCLSWYTLSCLPRWTFSPWNTLDQNIFYWYEITKFKIPSVHNLRVSLHA